MDSVDRIRRITGLVNVPVRAGRHGARPAGQIAKSTSQPWRNLPKTEERKGFAIESWCAFPFFIRVFVIDPDHQTQKMDDGDGCPSVQSLQLRRESKPCPIVAPFCCNIFETTSACGLFLFHLIFGPRSDQSPTAGCAKSVPSPRNRCIPVA